MEDFLTYHEIPALWVVLNLVMVFNPPFFIAYSIRIADLSHPDSGEVTDTIVVQVFLLISMIMHIVPLIVKPTLYKFERKDAANTFKRR